MDGTFYQVNEVLELTAAIWKNFLNSDFPENDLSCGLTQL